MDYEEILQLKETEQLEEAIAEEYRAELALDLEQTEEHKPQSDLSPEKKRLKRDIEREALARMEQAARTVEDFEQVVAWWDRLDSNRERKERYHEISRSGDDLPLEFGAAADGTVFPSRFNTVLAKLIQKGDFIDAICFCPYEIHELVTADYLSAALRKLSESHKEILFRNVVKGESTKYIGAIRGQTDRNIRKVKATALRKIHKAITPELIKRVNNKNPLTIEERRFVKNALDDNKSD